MEIITLIISILALVLSLIQFIRDASRQKKEATLNAYNILQDDVFSNLIKIDGAELNPPPDFRSEKYTKVTGYLSKIEMFSTGINTGVYSIWILNRLGGGFFVRQYDKLTPIIEKKRIENRSPGKHYDEFEKTVKKLKRIRRFSDLVDKLTRTGGTQ